MSYELEELEELDEPEFLRDADERESGTESMKARAGPATTLDKTIWTSGETGCWSLTMNRATGPLMPSGTTHWSKGRTIASGAPPISIWQVKFCSNTDQTLFGVAYWSKYLRKWGRFR